MKQLPKVQPDETGMRILADLLQETLPKEYGFTLLVFPFGENKRLANYISNANREDMIAMLYETVERLNNKRDFKTPNIN